MISVNEKAKANLNYCLTSKDLSRYVLFMGYCKSLFQKKQEDFTARIIPKAEFLTVTITVKTP